jgi:hypothetical protein
MAASRHYSRLISPPKSSFFLFGVRGAGKSTWARRHFPEAYLVDLLDESRRPFLPALPIAAALSLPPLLAVRGLTMPLPRLPLPPTARLVAACVTATARHRLPRPEDSPAALRQAHPAARPTSPPLVPSFGFRECVGRLDFWEELENLYRSPWEWLLPEAQASKGLAFPFGATATHGQSLNPVNLTQDVDWSKRKAYG